MTATLIDEIKGRGRRIAIFGPGLDRSKEQKRMLGLGIDIIITDRPDKLRKNIDRALSCDIY